jgi:hypothetical protein
MVTPQSVIAYSASNRVTFPGEGRRPLATKVFQQHPSFSQCR